MSDSEEEYGSSFAVEHQVRLYENAQTDIVEKCSTISLALLFAQHSDIYKIAEFNRNVKDWDPKQVQEFLYTLATSRISPSQSMMCKKVKKRTRGGKIVYKLFNGCHRYYIIESFLKNELCLEMYDDETEKNYFLWAKEVPSDCDKTENFVMESCLLNKIMNTQVQMTQLPTSMTDDEAYERAKIENNCKKLTQSQQVKCVLSRQTDFAKLLDTLCKGNFKCCEYFADDLYKIMGSALWLTNFYRFDQDFTNKLVLKEPAALLELIDEERDDFAIYKGNFTKNIKTVITDFDAVYVDVDPSPKATYKVGCILLATIMASFWDSNTFNTKANIKICMQKIITSSSKECSSYHNTAYHKLTTGRFPTKK